MNKSPLLSLCIPTYNRSMYLQDALESIINDPAFCDDIEIVISDNASTDNTQQIIIGFQQKYDNIHYYRNAENIGFDGNFLSVLQKANGKYIRLFNDILRFKEGGLKKMLDVISIESDDIPLFFYDNIPFINNINKTSQICGISDLINEVTFMVTWIANFGNWNKVVKNIENPLQYSDLLLSQVDWSYKIVSSFSKCSIYFNEYIYSVVPQKKGGYNLFEVFVRNYMFLIRKYEKNKKVISREKYRLFRYFLCQWIFNLYVYKDKFLFGKKNMFSILLNEYWDKPYFYLGFCYVFIKIAYYKILKQS